MEVVQGLGFEGLGCTGIGLGALLGLGMFSQEVSEVSGTLLESPAAIVVLQKVVGSLLFCKAHAFRDPACKLQLCTKP